jgi:molecular chaperone GrpE
MQETPDITNTPPNQDSAGGAASAAELEERLRKAEEAAQNHQDAWLRARAETENVRKRSQTEIANAHKFAVENFAGELLAVKDSLEAALASENASAESMRSGVELTLRQLKAVFDKFNIAEIDPTGQKFDPHHHQAITTAESDLEPNTVVQTLQKGYLLHERVIRPALVIVSKSKNAES